MRATINQPIVVDNSYDESGIGAGIGNGGSQISEPEILIPITPTEYTPPVKSTVNLEEVESQLPQNSSSQSGSSQATTSQSNSGTSTGVNPNAVPSATTGETKNYVDGGTTPDSKITVKKPKPNYLTLGIFGVIGLLVVYKLFFNKKSE